METEEMTHYIYVFSSTHNTGKLFKNEMPLSLWVKFLDRLFDQGCKIAVADEKTFKISNKKHYLRNSTYESLYEKPF